MDKRQKITLARIVAATLLLAAACCVPKSAATPRLLLFGAAYLAVGADVLVKAVLRLFRGSLFDENFLMSLATVGAFAIGEYPEAVAVMLFYQIGELFQEIAVTRSRASISALMDIRPDYARLENSGGETRQVAPETVPTGSVIVVRAGEKIPLDGTVIAGSSSLDTAALTGESLPREVTEGDAVLNGSLNLTGVLRIRTTGTYGESTVARILELVEHAETGKARTEQFITRFARYYTPFVVTAAVLLAVVVPLVTGDAWRPWINRSLIFLVISCPCALVVSIPLTFFAGIGCASRRGMLVKGSNHLETLAHVRTVVFDKTGTLTQGNFSVRQLCPQGIGADALIGWAALAESQSDHPVAAALRAAGGRIDPSRVAEAENIAGEGIVAHVREAEELRTVHAGNAKLMRRAGVEAAPCDACGTVVHVAVDGRYVGYVVVADAVKPQAAEAVARLRREGVTKVVMLTGDRREVAERTARALELDELHAELLPADKVARVESLRREGEGRLAFVGDGINDAPVLKLADVGIAMGAAGSDAAIEAADVVLMDDNPLKIAEGIALARNTLRIVRQNICFALGIKAAILLLGAIGYANMWAAVFADVGVTVLAVLNALRAMRYVDAADVAGAAGVADAASGARAADATSAEGGAGATGAASVADAAARQN